MTSTAPRPSSQVSTPTHSRTHAPSAAAVLPSGSVSKTSPARSVALAREAAETFSNSSLARLTLG